MLDIVLFRENHAKCVTLGRYEILVNIVMDPTQNWDLLTFIGTIVKENIPTHVF